jgi:alkyl hydroperoxide reductase subunit AhpF|tara:strand:+ start:919 stop:1428 length:510 start_codon:yes stop_codon:yes gene_type:complete
MSKSLENQRATLTKKVDELQVRAAEETFAITLDDRKQVKTVMEHLNKGYTWKTSNAAVLVSLYDQLKKQNKELLNSDAEDTVINLRGHELNALYQALLNVEGTGVESARKFITMLTHIGETVSSAMTSLAELNSEISETHKELAEVEDKLNNAEVVEPELEAATDETSK